MAILQFSILNRTKRRIPKIPFQEIKEKILGKNYELSLVFCGDKLSRRLNRTYRRKDRPTDILSFSISETSGEIFINPSRAKSFSIPYLFIHGLLHLKGFEHGRRMESRERRFLEEFNLQ